MGEPDELYTLRNLFWLGNYQLAINEANGVRGSMSVPLMVEKKEFLYRSYLALGQYDIITSEILNDAPAGRFLRSRMALSGVTLFYADVRVDILASLYLYADICFLSFLSFSS